MAFFREQGISSSYEEYMALPLRVVQDARLLAEALEMRDRREAARRGSQ